MILGKDDYWLECFWDQESDWALQAQEIEAQQYQGLGEEDKYE